MRYNKGDRVKSLIPITEGGKIVVSSGATGVVVEGMRRGDSTTIYKVSFNNHEVLVIDSYITASL